MQVTFTNLDNGKTGKMDIQLDKEVFNNGKTAYNKVYGTKAVKAAFLDNLAIGKALIGLSEGIADNITKGWVMSHHFPNLSPVDRSNLQNLYNLHSDPESGFETFRKANMPNVRTVNYILQKFRTYKKDKETIGSEDFKEWADKQEDKVPSVKAILKDKATKINEIAKAFKKAEKASESSSSDSDNSAASGNIGSATMTPSEFIEKLGLVLNQGVILDNKETLKTSHKAEIEKILNHFFNQVISGKTELKVATN